MNKIRNYDYLQPYYHENLHFDHYTTIAYS